MCGSDALVDDLMGTLANRAVDRSLGDRRTQYAEEIQRVLEATYDLIEQTGNVDPSLRDILAASNLSTQAFYRYFQSKDELFLLLLDDGRRRLVGSLERRMNKATTAADRVRGLDRGCARPGVRHAGGGADEAVPDRPGPTGGGVPARAAGVGRPPGRSPRRRDRRAARLREPTRRCRGRLPHGVRDAARSPDPRHPAYRRRDRTSRALLPRRDRRRSTRGGTT